MQKFEVTLESPVDAQSRVVSLDAPNADVAREVAVGKELKLVEFSLLPPERELWEQGQHIQTDGLDARVNLANWDAYHPKFARHAATLSYSEAVRAAEQRLRDLGSRVEVDRHGKYRHANLSPRALARLQAHRQSEPYAIVDVRRVDQAEIDAQRLVREIVAAKTSGDPRMWPLLVKRLREAGIPVNAVTATLAGISVQKQMDGSNPWVWSSAAIQTSLHTAYTFDQDTHDFFNDASATEITGTGYTASGVTLASKTSTYDTASDQSRQDAADVSWTTSTLSATDAVVWVNTAGASSTDMILGNVDFGATVSTTAGTFQITWDATGIIVVDIT
jgi:hypothetical protein